MAQTGDGGGSGIKMDGLVTVDVPQSSGVEDALEQEATLELGASTSIDSAGSLLRLETGACAEAFCGEGGDADACAACEAARAVIPFGPSHNLPDGHGRWTIKANSTGDGVPMRLHLVDLDGDGIFGLDRLSIDLTDDYGGVVTSDVFESITVDTNTISLEYEGASGSFSIMDIADFGIFVVMEDPTQDIGVGEQASVPYRLSMECMAPASDFMDMGGELPENATTHCLSRY